MHWMYAGLVDGNYAQIVSPTPFREPPLVDFDLLKIHPLETDFGMGDPGMFYAGSSEWTQPNDFHSPWFDRFLATTIAYGHIGYLTCEWGLPGTLKSYFLVKALQELYAGVEVVEIAYERGGQRLSTSEAVRSDAYRDGHVCVRYANGLRIWVNLGWEGAWEVKWKDETYLLPPTGWLAVLDGGVLAYSAVREGGRVDYLESGEYSYLDARDGYYRAPALAASGAAALKRGEGGGWWLIPATQAQDITVFPARFAPEWLGQEVAAQAYNEEGSLLGSAEIRRTTDGITVLPVSGAIKYLLRPQQALGSLRVEARAENGEVVPGQRVEVSAVIRNAGGEVLRGVAVRARWRDRRDGDWFRLADRMAPGAAFKHRFLLVAPPDLVPGERAWLEVEGRAGAEQGGLGCQIMVQFVVRPVLEIESAGVADVAYAAGGQTTLLFGVRYRGTAAAEARVRWRSGNEREIWLHQPLDPGGIAELRFAATMPEPGQAAPVDLWVGVPGCATAWQGWLTTETGPTMIYDFIEHIGEAVVGSELRDGRVALNDEGTGGRFEATQASCGGRQMPAIFAHPPWIDGVGAQFGRFQLDLPQEPALLHFAVGLRDGSTSQDGVVFKVTVDAGNGLQVVYQEQWNERRWLEQSVPLAKFAGRRIRLSFITDVGPADNSYSDWACWGAPRLELQQPSLRLLLTQRLPPEALLPPDEALHRLSTQELHRVASGMLCFEAAGVNQQAPYTSYVYLNDVPLGETPASESDTAWSSVTMPLPKEALAHLRPRNEVEFRNPGRDCFKVRRVYLRLVLQQGEVVASLAASGPFTSDKGWLYAEGAAVPLGEPLEIAVAVSP